jgi:peptidoglycan/LPS O-acetylase OafA/YrhL
MQDRTTRLYLLDVVRGLASLAVVLWHYQHFFFIAPGQLPDGFDRAVQPFYALLSVFYEHGARAVQLFFVLSGFVFFHQYAEAIRSGRVDAWTFAVLRFSRLYPLHFVTLIIVAVGQLVSQAIDGQFVVYPCNGLKEFILNALFISYWLPLNWICWSFNCPVWSVSVEIFLYILFFLFALVMPKGWWLRFGLTAAVVAASVVWFRAGGFHLIGQPVFSFFSGGLAYLVWERASERRWPLGALSAGAFLVVGSVLIYFQVTGIRDIILDAVGFPALILGLALLQSIHAGLGKRLRLVGDITYSTYLLHFPLQLGLIILAKIGLLRLDYTRPAAWALFFVLLLAVSVPTYYYFEFPVQTYFRRKLLG